MPWYIKYKWTIQFSLISPVLTLICVILMGGGHGTYEPAMIFFPWGWLWTLFDNEITLPFIIIAFLQYTLYGVIIDKATAPYKKWRAVLFLVFTHFVLVALIISRSGPNWS